MSELSSAAATWMVTMLLHSTLWLGGVALFLRFRPGAPARLRDFLWRAALVASLLTPTAQLVAAESFGWEPFGGALRLGAAETESVIPLVAAPAIGLSSLGLGEGSLASEGALSPALLEVAIQPPLQAPAMLAAEPTADWHSLVLGSWALVAGLGVAYLLRGTLRFRRSLGARQDVGESASARALRKLLDRAGKRGRGVRLTSSESLRVPVALGVFRREICVPQRALRDLPPTQQRAMIGHEFAHLLRLDPAWLGSFELARRLFFFQPLFAVAQRRAQEAAEELCDAWAAQRTGDPVALAECLVEVARWLEPRTPPGSLPFAAACMARPDSPLARRIDALLGARVEAAEGAPRGLRLGACALALSAAAFLPGFSAKPAELSLEARFALVTAALAEVQSDLAAAREDAPSEPRLALIGERLAGLRAQADLLSAQISR